MTDRPSSGVREPTDEELKFTGLNRGEIPSKSFQRLQSWTGAGQYIIIIIIIVVVVVVIVVVVVNVIIRVTDDVVNTTRTKSTRQYTVSSTVCEVPVLLWPLSRLQSAEIKSQSTCICDLQVPLLAMHGLGFFQTGPSCIFAVV